MMNNNRKIITIALLVGGALLIGAVIYGIYQESRMHLVSSSPANLSQTVTPTDRIVFTFNRNLSQDTKNNFKILPNIKGVVSISGKTLTFIPSTSYDVNTTYTATLDKPKGADGSTGDRIAIQFQPTYVAYGDMTSQQKQDALKMTDSNQTTSGYSADSITFSGSDADLVGRGLSIYQLRAFRVALYQYLIKSNQKVFNVAISNVSRPPFDPSSDISTFNLNLGFDNGTSYSAKVETSELTSARLYIYNTENKQLFDSGTVKGN